MSIVKLQPDINLPSTTTLPHAIQEPNKSIFTSLVPESRITSLLKYVEGLPWTINYYGQILNVNNTLENYDPSSPNLTQPYYLIINLILQVSSPLTSDYNADTGVTTVSGSAIAPYKVSPSVGDVFIAKVDTTEDAIFTITSVTRKTYRKDTIYEVSYSLYSYVSTNPGFVTTLDNKVQDKFYFNKDSNFFNRDVLLKPSVKEAIDRLNTFIHTSQEYYFNTFIQTTTGSIMAPGTNSIMIDTLLIDFILATVDYNNLRLRKLAVFNHSNNTFMDQPSIFTALLTRNKAIIPNINKQYRYITTGALSNIARYGTPFFANLDFILFPLHPDRTIRIKDLERLATIIGEGKEVRNLNNYSVSTKTIAVVDNIVLLLHTLFDDDYYVVSENFYNYMLDPNDPTNTPISYIEFIIYKFLNGEAINKEDLVIAIESYNEWSLLHQMYLLPVMWLIIRNNT